MHIYANIPEKDIYTNQPPPLTKVLYQLFFVMEHLIKKKSL